MIMVKAGKAVDDFIEQILPHLEPGDILIDGGNTHYPDTIRRTAYVEGKGMLYVGTGVSGGEEGALTGPSIMPGGSPAAWPQVKPIFQAIAAKTEDGDALLRLGRRERRRPLREDGPQRDRVRRHAAHLRGLRHPEERARDDGLRDARRLRRVEQGRARQLPDRDHPRHPRLQGRRTASRSWTGSSTPPARRAPASGPASRRSTSASPSPSSARPSSRAASRRSRRSASPPPRSSPARSPRFEGDRKAFVEDIRQALYASKMVSYAQGYTLMRAAAEERGWNLNYGGVALMWRGRLHHPLGLPGQDQGGLRHEPRASPTCSSTRSSATRW